MSHNSKYYTKKLKSKDGRKCQKITTFLKPEPKADDDDVAPELAITDTVSVSVDLASDIDITAEKCSSETLCNILRQGLLQSRSIVPAVSCTSAVQPSVHRFQGCRHFHATGRSFADFDPDDVLQKNHFFPKIPKKWLKYNDIVYPPQKPGEPKRPAEICHMVNHVKYSPDKMWYMASMIRGMSIDEALKQLSVAKHKGAHIIKETLLETQEMAVRDHNVEFKSNLWVEDTRVGRGRTFKGYRACARGRVGIVHYKHCHFFVRLREGKPPKHYYPPPETGYEKLERYIKDQRRRRIMLSL